MKRSIIAALLALILLTGTLLTGCGSGSDAEVSVESVSVICGLGNTAAAQRFAGIVVSSNTVKVQRDETQKVVKVNVKVGDSVSKGDVLFSYDEATLKLSVQKLNLEKEQLEALIKSMKEEITSLKKRLKTATADTKLQLTIDLQQMEIDLKESENSLASKKTDITTANNLLKNVNVAAPVDGRIQAIDEDGINDEGVKTAYMTIVENGSYRVECRINEMNVYSIYEGMAVTIYSRMDNTVTWSGAVETIDTSEAVTDNKDGMYYSGSSDEMTSSSNYAFYVTLFTSEGLILGQHVYLETGSSGAKEGIWLPEYYISDADSAPWAWAATKRDTLEKRKLTLGEHDAETATWQVLDGLTAEDYIAFPSEDCAEGVKVTRYDENSFGGNTGNGEEGLNGGEGMTGDDGMMTGDEGMMTGNEGMTGDEGMMTGDAGMIDSDPVAKDAEALK